MDDYARSGLRTLCLAKREITQQEYDEWDAVYTAAGAYTRPLLSLT
jgi:phospholipid-transporting ATPase